jgi:pimeloyl-ACP methyl ester carboxylesterase
VTPMILVHGAFTTAASMAALGLLLARGRRVLVVDLPNFDYSFSSLPPTADAEPDPNSTPADAPTHAHTARAASSRPCGFAALADAIEQLVLHLCATGSASGGGASDAPPSDPRPSDVPCGHVDLLGHSFGANIVLRITRRLPQHVRHVHLLAPGGASAATFSSITSPPDFSAVPPSVRPLLLPAILGIFASPNFINLLFSPSYIETIRRQVRHASSHARWPHGMGWHAADAQMAMAWHTVTWTRPRDVS